MGKSHLGDSAQKNHEMTALQPTSDYDFKERPQATIANSNFPKTMIYKNKMVMIILEVRYYSAKITKIIGIQVDYVVDIL